MPRAHSCIQSRAKTPRSVSSKILRISASSITRGPRVRTANSHVRLHRLVRYSSIPTLVHHVDHAAQLRIALA